MRRIIVVLPLKKFFICLAIFIIFIISLSVILVGIGNGKNNSNIKFNLKPDNVISDSKGGEEIAVNVYLTKDNNIKKIALEDYVRGVIAGEMPEKFNMEALKAQAVAARTYALAHIEAFGGTKSSKANGADVSDSIDCQVYMTKEDRFKAWPADKCEEYWNKLTMAVRETEGQILTYDGKLVMEPYYFAVSSGRTDNAKDVFNSSEPYLQSVKSEGEESAPEYKELKKLSLKEFVDKINSSNIKEKLTYNNAKNNVVIGDERTESGTVKKVKIGSNFLDGTEFRKLFDLKSANFKIDFTSDNNVQITTIGYGHNVGMSQWGANVMANEGKNYLQVLMYYYKGVRIEKVNDLKK